MVLRVQLVVHNHTFAMNPQEGSWVRGKRMFLNRQQSVLKLFDSKAGAGKAHFCMS
jgi:hypothetical protein